MLSYHIYYNYMFTWAIANVRLQLNSKFEALFTSTEQQFGRPLVSIMLLIN